MLGDLYLKLLEMLIKTFIICIEYYEALQNYYIIFILCVITPRVITIIRIVI